MNKISEQRFIFRAGGICFENDRILIHRADQDSFWALPGGKCEIGESSIQALSREMMEEMNVSIKVGPLLWVIENFFEYGGAAFHEIGLYYRFEFSEKEHKYLNETQFEGVEAFTENGKPLKLHFKWLPLSDLDSVDIRPKIFQQVLKKVPLSTVHLIQREV